MPASKAPELAGTTITFLALSIVLVSSRVYVKLFITREFKADDALIIVSLLLFVGFSAVVLQGIAYGNGQHIADLSPERFSGAMEMWYIGELLYSGASTTVRLSVGMLIISLTSIRWHRKVIYFAMGLSTVTGILIFAVFLFQCQPVGFFWSATRNPMDGHCIDSQVLIAVLYMHAAVCCVCDLILALIPWHLVQALKSNRRTKIAIGFLLCFANIGCIAAMIRFYAIKLISVSNDFTFVATDLAIWSGLEIGIAIPAASSVTMRPLFRSWRGKWESYRQKTHERQEDGLPSFVKNENELFNIVDKKSVGGVSMSMKEKREPDI